MTNDQMTNDQLQLSIRIPRSLVYDLLLVAILIVGACLRFTGLNWDERQWIHPDEGHMRIITSAIRMPDSASLYFDTHNSPLNCRNSGQQYSYGTLPLFLTRMTAEWLDTSCGEDSKLIEGKLSTTVVNLLVEPLPEDTFCYPGTFTGGGSAQVGRMLAGMADLGTILLVYLIARRLYGEAAGLLAASLYALTAFSIQQTHFFTVDSAACFFTTLTVYFSVRAGQSGSWLNFGMAGLATGFAAACKVSAVFVSLCVVLAALWWWLQSQNSRDDSEPAHSPSPNPKSLNSLSLVAVIGPLILAGLLAIVAFRIGQPYAFEGPGFFGVKPSPEWFGRLSQIRGEQSGEVDLPYGRQWTDRAPIVFPWINMVVWGMGLPLGLAAWAGWAVAGYELFRGKKGKYAHLILWVWVTIMFLYQGSGWVKSMRYLLALYPLLVIMAAYLLVRLCRASARHWRYAGFGLAGIVVVGTVLWASAFFSIYIRTNTRVAASRWIYDNVPPGVTIANEHYDWGVPLRVDGQNPFGGMYSGIEMQHYHEDTPDKLGQLYSWLEQADYICTASNRLYASIPRLPPRYPLTIEYYRALFAGELGFELVADFSSRLAIGPFQFPDQENPFPLMETGYVYQTNPIKISLPPAEEAFSVYDHPRVLIFRKTDAYSHELVESVLGKIDLGQVMQGFSPMQATTAPNLLQFDPETWADQQAGGTWSEMFDRDSLFNRYPALAVVLWWIVVAVLGWLAFPLLFVALPRLSDRGYGLARVLGMLIIAYLTWIAASMHLLPNTRGTILRMTMLLALVGGGVGWARWDELRRFLRQQRRLILLTEGLFALLYLAWVGVRLLHPDLWHPSLGGEKPMDFAYLNAVMKSTWFPPYNPWFAGSVINYYYFGFVIVGTLVKLTGTTPEIAYNLIVPLLFALTGVGAFSVAYNLFGGGRRRSAVWAGVTALVFEVVLGNLGVVRLMRLKLTELGNTTFPSTVSAFPDAVAALRGLWEVIAHGAKLPMRIEAWYWYPTRIIPSDTGNPIAEFPAFTFLYGDLHAHMIALSLTLLALTLAVYWMRTSRPSMGSVLIGGVAIGALWPTNTWDFFTYLALGLVAMVIGARRQGGKETRGLGEGQGDKGTRRQGWGGVGRAALLVGLSLLLYRPYFQNYAAGYNSVERWEGLHTSLNIYLWIHGVMLFPLLTRMLIEAKRTVGRMFPGFRSKLALAVFIVGLAVMVLAMFVMGYEVAAATVPLGLLAAYLLLVPDMPSRRRFLWFMIGTAMALGLAVEIIVIKGDIGRQNTVFKFYLQVWTLLSVAGGVSVAWVYEHARRWKPELSNTWWLLMGALILGGALFLPYGIRARAVDRMSPDPSLTLDGMAYMEDSKIWDGEPSGGGQDILLNGDYHAIRWIQENVQGSPVILEGLGHREYLWCNRVSIYTGLPSPVGWRWHEVQQYAALPDYLVNNRRSEVRDCYNTTNPSYAQEILARHNVRFIYVGDYERAYYEPTGLAKFDYMVSQELLRVAYDDHGVKIYETTGNWIQNYTQKSDPTNNYSAGAEQ